MKLDRTADPLELFVGLVDESLGNIEAEMQELRELRDKIEKPKEAMEKAEDHLAKHQFSEALSVLEPIVETMPERTDLAGLQKNGQQLRQLQRSHQAVSTDKQTATFDSLVETLGLCTRALAELPARFHSYPLEVQAGIKTRQLHDLDVLLLAPGVFTERADWLRRTWPNDIEVDNAITREVNKAVGGANNVVKDIKAGQFPGSALEWEEYVARARRLMGAIRHLVERKFVSPDAAQLSELLLGELEKRATAVRMLDGLCCQAELTDEERRTVLELAAKHGLVLLSSNHSVNAEVAALERRIRDREQKTDEVAHSRRITRIADALTQARPQALKAQIEEALEEFEEFGSDEHVQQWLRLAMDTMAEVEESLGAAEQLVIELQQPQSILAPVETKVKTAKEAYETVNGLLNELQRKWPPETGVALRLKSVQQPQWSEFWAERTAKLQHRLNNQQAMDSLEAIISVEHLLPLLRECLVHEPNESLAGRVQQIGEDLPKVWKAQLTQSGLFDIVAARRRIANALLLGSERYRKLQDDLSAAWLAMLAVAATSSGETEEQVVQRALQALDTERISQAMQSAMQSIVTESEQRLQSYIDLIRANLEQQMSSMQAALLRERTASLDNLRNLLPSKSQDAIDIDQMHRLLVAMRQVPAGAGHDRTDLRQLLETAVKGFGRRYATAQGVDSVRAMLLYREAQIYVESIFKKVGGLQ